MKVAYYYFPGLNPDEITKDFENMTLAVAWGKWYCEQNGGDNFSVLYGKTFRTYKFCEGYWNKNGKSNKNKTIIKSHSVKEEPTSRGKCRNRDPSTYSEEFKKQMFKKV